MGFNVDYKKRFEENKEGLDALVQRLGKVETVRFLQLFIEDNHDSVVEKHRRDAMFEAVGVTLDDILNDMRKTANDL
jgi:hypothetical protein